MRLLRDGHGNDINLVAMWWAVRLMVESRKTALFPSPDPFFSSPVARGSRRLDQPVYLAWFGTSDSQKQLSDGLGAV